MSNEILLGVGIAVSTFSLVGFILNRHCRAFVVPEGYAGVLCRKGEFAELLSTGWHIRWGCDYTFVAQDLRKAVLAMPGRALLTSDGVNLRLSLVLCYEVTDPIRVARAGRNWFCSLCQAGQTSLEDIVGGVSLEFLLSNRLEVEAQLLAVLSAMAEGLGISIHQVEVVFGWVEASPLRHSPRSKAAQPAAVLP